MSRIKQFFVQQAGLQFCLLPLLFALGIAAYFALPREPDWRYLLALVAVLAMLTAWAGGRHRLRWAVLLVPMLGMSWACISAAWHAPVMLPYELTPRPLVGIVHDIERVEKGVRLTLDVIEIRGLDAAKTPSRVRLSLRLKPENNLSLPRIGDRISLLAGLLPPMGSAIPGGFDFARYFYFRGIGAVGYGLPPWKVEIPVADTGFVQWRVNLTQRIITALGPQRGPIAAGLITGEDRAITESDFEALRASNLYHIIAISGGHMVVIAGVIFIGLRLLFLLLPRAMGQRPQAKSVAAGITLVLVTVYLFVTGMPISAVRAYVMIVLVLLAVLLRRDADALRSLILAALMMLVFDPSDLLEPGFQLSFAATLAIVALAQGLWVRTSTPEDPWYHRAWRIVVASVLISLVAEAATALLVVGMFNTFSAYGVLANALATPLVALVLMPAVALFFLLLPFGWESAALWIIDFGIRALLAIAQWISALPHAQHFLPSPPAWGMALGIVGLFWLCLLHGRVRLLGAGMLLLAWLSITTTTLPDLLVGTNAKQIALRLADGSYALVRGRPDSLVPELWANGLGYKQLPILKPGSESWRCDRVSCVATIKGKRFAFPQDAYAFAEDCARADRVLTTLRTRGCRTGFVSSYALARLGVHAFWIAENGSIRQENSAQWQGMRPWSVRWQEQRD